MKYFRFKTQGLYTIVYNELSRTFLMEIAITRKDDYRPQYKITRLFKGIDVIIPPKNHRFGIPAQRQLQNWLIFEGHDLPILINATPILDEFHPFRFITNNPDELRAFIAQNCLNPSIAGFASISYSSQKESQSRGTTLFTPVRTLHGSDLYEETEMFPGVYHAIDHKGDAVLHDGVFYHGHVHLVSSSPVNYVVEIWKNQFYPSRIFNRKGYKSQETANKALLHHANRLYKPNDQDRTRWE